MRQRSGARRLVWAAFIACAVILVIIGVTRSRSAKSASPATRSTDTGSTASATSPSETTATGAGSSTATGTSATTSTVAAQTTTTGTSTTAARPAVDAGKLPQTRALPSSGAPLTASMQTMWNALVAGSPSAARPVFFPEGAYLQMKTGRIAYPASDYKWRLIAFYDLDIAAYHAHLGRTPSAAKLVAVHANPALARWIAPGACENSVGYWHLPGTRLVYTLGGRTYSVRVASLISWRGVWYVVHLGPNPRPVNVGTVDDPQVGAGVPGPGGGC
jgi:hypothetical protein